MDKPLSSFSLWCLDFVCIGQLSDLKCFKCEVLGFEIMYIKAKSSPHFKTILHKKTKQKTTIHEGKRQGMCSPLLTTPQIAL